MGEAVLGASGARNTMSKESGDGRWEKKPNEKRRTKNEKRRKGPPMPVVARSGLGQWFFLRFSFFVFRFSFASIIPCEEEEPDELRSRGGSAERGSRFRDRPRDGAAGGADRPCALVRLRPAARTRAGG